MLKVLPKNICVAFSNQSSSVYIVPPNQWVGRFVGPCPGLGPGEQYRFVDVNLTFEVDGKEYTAQGTKLFTQETGAFDSEWYGFTLPNGFGVNFFGKPPPGMGEGDYLKDRAALLRILETLTRKGQPDMTLPGWTCAGSFTQLLPGTFAQVKTDNNTPNRVRSEPKKGDNTIAQLYPGTSFELLEGPVCADGLVFWKIHNSAIPGEERWTVEGDGIKYYLVPFRGN